MRGYVFQVGVLVKDLLRCDCVDCDTVDLEWRGNCLAIVYLRDLLRCPATTLCFRLLLLCEEAEANVTRACSSIS